MRVHDREGAEIGLYTFDDVGQAVAPGEMTEGLKFYFSNVEGKATGETLNKITLIEVQPFVDDNGQNVYCRVASQKVGGGECY